MKPGEADAVVIDHRARDRELSPAGVEELDDPALARPVDDRAGRDLPEATPPILSGARADPVGVYVPVEPEHDVVEAKQELQQLADVWLGSRIPQRVQTVMRGDHDQAVFAPGAHHG